VGSDPVGNLSGYTYPKGVQPSYNYDPLNRLNVTNGYSYDAVGNRRQWLINGATVNTYNYDADDRLGADQYDPNGNTTNSLGSASTYDFENHMLSKGAVTIVYDGDGNRVSETVGGVTTNYLVDTQNPTGYAQVVDELQNGSVTRIYSYGLERVNEKQAGGMSFYGYDGHGSVRQLFNSSGAVTDTYDYDAFGNLISSTGSTPNVYLFAGEAYDSALGLYYNRARYMNTATGRFWSMDSYPGQLADPQSLHKYLYCGANPVGCTDPSGHEGDFATTMGVMGGMNTIASISLPQLINIAGATATALILIAAAPDIEAALDRYSDRFAQHQAVFTQALSTFWYHFNRWQNDPDSGKGGNHAIRIGVPTGVTTTPEVTLETVPIVVPFFKFKVNLEVYEGGGPGRVFEVDYRIGAKAGIGNGRFFFRLDYLDFRSFPPVPFPHIHYGYSLNGQPQKSGDHEPL
jgi:RHS repeat-associated protein